MKILVGDIGGTKADLAVFSDDKITVNKKYLVEDYSSFDLLLQDFCVMSGCEGIRFASIAVAGPVVQQSVTLTNLEWDIHAAKVRQKHAWQDCFLLNDLAAHAYGILAHFRSHRSGKFLELKKGKNTEGNIAVIAPGTGLGEAIIARENNDKFLVLASEGGHSSFAPTDETELAFLQFCWKKHSHVSQERVLAGAFSFRLMYEFFREKMNYSSNVLQEAYEEGQPIGPVIGVAARTGDDFALKIVDFYLGILGSEAGNLALKANASGGVYLTGSIARNLSPFIARGSFSKKFIAKGRFSGFLESLPVILIEDEWNALYGAREFVLQNN